jgi:hypothetical protein
MAVSQTVRVLHDGIKNLVVQVNLSADVAGDMSPTAIVDVSALSPKARSVKVNKATWSSQGGDVRLFWDNYGADDEPVILMTGQGSMDYCSIGGMPNKGEAPNGDMLMSTNGFTAGSSATVLLELKKKY